MNRISCRNTHLGQESIPDIEEEVPEEIQWVLNQWKRVRPQDFSIGKDFILESFRIGKESKGESHGTQES